MATPQEMKVARYGFLGLGLTMIVIGVLQRDSWAVKDAGLMGLFWILWEIQNVVHPRLVRRWAKLQKRRVLFIATSGLAFSVFGFILFTVLFHLRNLTSPYLLVSSTAYGYSLAWLGWSRIRDDAARLERESSKTFCVS